MDVTLIAGEPQIGFAEKESEAFSKKALEESLSLPDKFKQIAGAEKIDSEPGSKDEESAESKLDVGLPIYWSLEKREKSRPKAGEGYYDTMKTLGENLLGRPLSVEEIKALTGAAAAMQKQRGKDPNQLNSRDELLPKNLTELQAFLDGMGKGSGGPLSERTIDELKQKLLDEFAKQLSPSKNELDLSLRPVTDQPVVTKVVPNAVYIDSSHIEGGQGYRRTTECTPETQTYWLSKPTAEALMRVQAALKADGKEAVVLRNMNAAGRRALDRELIKKCAPNQPHAKKRSTHEDGISLDVDNYDNLDVRKALEKEGFVRNVPNDRPHFTRYKK